MSIQATNAVLQHSQSKGNARVVLHVIASFIGDDPAEGCWPTVATIARLSNISTRQVHRELQKLVELGELEYWSNDGEGPVLAQRSNRYYLKVVCPENCDSSLQHRIISWTLHKAVDNSENKAHTL